MKRDTYHLYSFFMAVAFVVGERDLHVVASDILDATYIGRVEGMSDDRTHEGTYAPMPLVDDVFRDGVGAFEIAAVRGWEAA